MKLLRFRELAAVVTAVRKYKCLETDIEGRAAELSFLLSKSLKIGNKKVVKTARLFFIPCAPSEEKADKEILSKSTLAAVGGGGAGTVMHLDSSIAEHLDYGNSPPHLKVAYSSNNHRVLSKNAGVDHSETKDENAQIVATARASDQFQFIMTLELAAKLAPGLTPYFRVLSGVLAGKVCGNESTSTKSSEEMLELYELALQESLSEESHKSTKIKGAQFAASLDDNIDSERRVKEEFRPFSNDSSFNHIAEWSKSLADTLPIIVWTADPEGNVDYINQKWTEYTGLAKSQALGHGFGQAIHPDDFEAVFEQFQHCMKNGLNFESEHRLLDLNSRQYRWFIVQATPVRTPDGEIKLWFGTCSDINEQKSAQERLQCVMDTIPEAIFWKDVNSVYLGGNKLFAQLGGYETVEQMIGRTDHEMPWTKQETEFYLKCDRHIIENDAAEYNIVEPLTKQDGLVAWLSTTKIPMHDADGKVTGVLAMSQDITERVRLHRQREDFMASLAHDLKVPVVGAVRALDALLQGYVGPLDERQIDFIQCLHRSHENLLLMIKNLLQVLQHESGDEKFTLEHVDLVRVVNEMVKASRPAIVSKGLNFDLDVSSKLILSADRGALKSVVANLIGNAITSAPEHTAIKIRLFEEKETAVMEVHNGGEPISDQDMEQLFQRLWQGKRFGAGAGLGMYLCRQVAEGHGGTMTCQSSREDGTVFRFCIPLIAQPNKQDSRMPKRSDLFYDRGF